MLPSFLVALSHSVPLSVRFPSVLPLSSISDSRICVLFFHVVIIEISVFFAGCSSWCLCFLLCSHLISRIQCLCSSSVVGVPVSSMFFLCFDPALVCCQVCFITCAGPLRFVVRPLYLIFFHMSSHHSLLIVWTLRSSQKAILPLLLAMSYLSSLPPSISDCNNTTHRHTSSASVRS